ncbi:acyltransferase [Celerinatantimonas diazotrophica]|uniref:Acetyltransferase-like isoleucine patch superfamily enzyme n=1 Tax=Celerinatantimonas diazotrophica TaxID=412034 RepID=A0A4R1J9L4_9GAMM|nr:acyltransferase [Celerinatantimonas diazotrophica]TCK47303.1 acetyltransferase-like isoleucine patch superfamily enzyme [Celerinatantimonas diazotrophica]CAG9296076.1 UDP-3-O-(3-hydroxymyristoyl)glucosamine N-acyltransferase [Celerinatantimonas diazotrophica]
MSDHRTDPSVNYIEQHKQRLSWMPWLYYRLKPRHLSWAKPWQEQIQSQLSRLETVQIDQACFIAPQAQLFAEPGRNIAIGKQSFIAAECFLHGPITIGQEVGINHRCSFDGGAAGIEIGNRTRIANSVQIFAFNHGMHPDQSICQQNTTSKGVKIGEDVWIGAGVGIVDGVTVADHAVIGMHSTVTKNVPSWAIVAGNPAKIIGDRRDKS